MAFGETLPICGADEFDNVYLDIKTMLKETSSTKYKFKCIIIFYL